MRMLPPSAARFSAASICCCVCADTEPAAPRVNIAASASERNNELRGTMVILLLRIAVDVCDVDWRYREGVHWNRVDSNQIDGDLANTNRGDGRCELGGHRRGKRRVTRLPAA